MPIKAACTDPRVSPPVDQADAWQQAILAAAAKVQGDYPDLWQRCEDAVALVFAGAVSFDGDGGHVQSRTDPNVWHEVNGTCHCKDAEYGAPNGFCAHRLAVGLIKRVQAVADTQESVPPPQAPEATPDIPARFLVQIHGKPFVQYAGLLFLAHARGLVSLKAHFISVTSELALAEAEATFADGHTYGECADSTPENVHQKVRAHFPRMALTRAKARCLRDALCIEMCSVEELD